MRKTSLLLLVFLLSATQTSAQTANGTCEPGWTWYWHSNGNWCMKVFAGSHSWWEAAGLCQAQGARLSGPSAENVAMGYNAAAVQKPILTAEFLQVTANMTNDVQPNFWVGARRAPQCMYKQYLRGGVPCIVTKTAFVWTDGHNVGANGLDFEPGEPNNIGGLEDCAAFRSNMMLYNDFDCSLSTVTRGYVCGKPQIDPK